MAGGPACEDIEDELGAVEDLASDDLLDVADLAGVLRPPLVLGEVTLNDVADPNNITGLFDERVALMRGPSTDVVAEAEVVDVAKELLQQGLLFINE